MYKRAFSASDLNLNSTYAYPFGRFTKRSIINVALTTSPKLPNISFRWPSFTFLVSCSTQRVRDSTTGEAFLGGGEGFLDCRGGERPRLPRPTGLFLAGGLRLRELTLREGDEEDERDLEREREREKEEERESEPEKEREREGEEDPDGGERRPRLGFAMAEARSSVEQSGGETLDKPLVFRTQRATATAEQSWNL